MLSVVWRLVGGGLSNFAIASRAPQRKKKVVGKAKAGAGTGPWARPHSPPIGALQWKRSPESPRDPRDLQLRSMQAAPNKRKP